MTATTLPRQRGAFSRTRDHWWWRDGWAYGTRYLTWHLTFEGASALHETVERAGAALKEVPGVDVVPVPWLHLTMTGVGFAQDIDSPARAAVIESGFAAASDIAAEPLVFDRLFLYEEGVCLSATATWLQELKARLDERMAAAGGPVVEADRVFHPHVSLGYFSREIDEPSLDAALDRARIGPVTVASPRLSLLELGRDDKVYTWNVVAQRALIS